MDYRRYVSVSSECNIRHQSIEKGGAAVCGSPRTRSRGEVPETPQTRTAHYGSRTEHAGDNETCGSRTVGATDTSAHRAALNGLTASGAPWQISTRDQRERAEICHSAREKRSRRQTKRRT